MHYVQYHNVERMGGMYRRVDGEPYRIVTNKAVDGLIGERVWLIAGDGKPRQYSLVCTFTVDATGESDDPNFAHFASGTVGESFAPPIPLGSYPWFQELLRQQQNFKLGLNMLDDETVQELVAISRR